MVFFRSFLNWILFVSWLSHTIASAWAQLTPPIENYLPEVYGGENQSWSITQAENGSVYFANHIYLLEFNGNQWKPYRSESYQPIRKVFAFEDRVYSAGYMTFGYWERDAKGAMKYHSLTEQLNIPILNGEEFWDIQQVDGLLVFQSLSRIYIVDQSLKTYDIIKNKTTKAGLYLIDGTLFFVDSRKGLRKIQEGLIQPIKQQSPTKNDVVGLIYLNKSPHFVTSTGDLYALEDDALELSSVNFNAYDEIYCIYQSASGEIYLGTVNKGLISFNSQQELSYQIDKNSGGVNNTVLSLLEDQEGNIWAGLDRGIMKLNLLSHIQEYNNNPNDLGSVYASIEFEGRWYLGTNQGLFCSTAKGRSFELVKGTSGQVWGLDAVAGNLFCSHNRGLFQVEGTTAKWLGEQNGSWRVKLHKDSSGQSLLISGGYEGLYIYHQVNGRWQLRNQLEGLNISSRFFEFASTQKWLVNHEFLGVYIFEVDEGFNRITRLDHKKPFGDTSNLFHFLDNLYYLNSNGVFSFQESENNFVFDSLMTAKTDPQTLKSSYIYSPMEEYLLMFSEQGLRRIRSHDLNQTLLVDEIYLPPFVMQNLGNPGFENVHPLASGNFIVGLSDGFITTQSTYEPGPVVQEPFLNEVSLLVDDQWTSVALQQTSQVFPFDKNSIRFSFHVPCFQKHEPIVFQTRLLGAKDQWSSWGLEATQEYYKLKPGNYVFEVRFKKGAQLGEETLRYAFNIARPWYLTDLMVILYIGLIALTVSLIFRLGHRYRKVQIRLREEKADRIQQLELLHQKNNLIQGENDQLRQELHQKKRELTFTHQNILKNNSILTRVKANLEREESNYPKLQETLQLIDKNLNSQDDWQNFEKSFNELDNNFIVKIKTQHKSLTPQDIRLISYIRVNLDSKEIAELLNITTKSVEMKRYRLKKKLNLKQEDKLSDYILSIGE